MSNKSSSKTPSMPLLAPNIRPILPESIACCITPQALEFITAVGPPDWATIALAFAPIIHYPRKKIRFHLRTVTRTATHDTIHTAIHAMPPALAHNATRTTVYVATSGKG
jgi:hypothetical protein